MSPLGIGAWACAVAATFGGRRAAGDAWTLGLEEQAPEVSAAEARVRDLREARQVNDDATTEAELQRALAALHALPPYRRLGALLPSEHVYGTPRLLGDQAAITAYQRGTLLHGKPVQFLDAPSMRLAPDGLQPGWAAYNPSILPITWLGQSAFLVTHRVSTWSLCAWNAVGSPLDQLPLERGKRTVTSRIVAGILGPDFGVLLAGQEIPGLAHEEHFCNHHIGMRRVGVDDGRLFSLDGKPWLIFAAVALKGESAYCFHHLMLCPLGLPASAAEKVRCLRKTLVRFKRADEISEDARRSERWPNVHQKNWNPFVVNGRLYLVFTIVPLTVVQVDPETGTCTQVSEVLARAFKVFQANAPEGRHNTFAVHGGSPYVALPAPHGRELLGIGRVARANTQYVSFFHTLVAIGGGGGGGSGTKAKFAVARVSPLFCIASTSPGHAGLCETIQFAGGLVLLGEDTLVVTYGTNDCEGKVAFLRLQRVLDLLLPAD